MKALQDKGSVLTTFHGENGDVVHRVDFSVQRFRCANDSSHGINVEKPLQVGIAVYGVPESPIQLLVFSIIFFILLLSHIFI